MKMLISVAQDLRVIIIKFADRLHNMKTIKHMPVIKRHRIAIETRALTPLVNAMTSSYQTAISAGLGSEPKSAIIKIYEQVLGTEFSDK